MDFEVAPKWLFSKLCNARGRHSRCGCLDDAVFIDVSDDAANVIGDTFAQYYSNID